MSETDLLGWSVLLLLYRGRFKMADISQEENFFYIELCKNPIQFEPFSKVTNVFFDDSNRQVYNNPSPVQFNCVFDGHGHHLGYQPQGTSMSTATGYRVSQKVSHTDTVFDAVISRLMTSVHSKLSRSCQYVLLSTMSQRHCSIAIIRNVRYDPGTHLN
jgi:hypothetical protein